MKGRTEMERHIHGYWLGAASTMSLFLSFQSLTREYVFIDFYREREGEEKKRREGRRERKGGETETWM